MEKINFKNGQSPALNATNLNKMQTNIENEINLIVVNAINELKNTTKELYTNESGTNNATITLNDDISNYKEVEILFSMLSTNSVGVTSKRMKSVKALVGHQIALEGSVMGYFKNVYGSRMYSTHCDISGNTLTKTNGYTHTFSTSGAVSFSENENGIYIHRVVGYK
jgi:hypothetical protein